MKKFILVLALVVGILGFGMLTINAYGYSPFGIDRVDYQNNDNDYYYNHMGRNHMSYNSGGCYYEDIEDYDYEQMYSHLSEEDQTEIDLLYIQKLSEYDVDLMTETELNGVIEIIKSEIIEYIIDNDMHHYW